jgi:uncharacterized protein (TIGR02588 family)
MSTHGAKKRKPHDLTPAMEWIIGSFGAALFLFGLTFLTVEGMRGDNEPGSVSFRVDEIVHTEGAYLVRYTARNHGSQTLADVQISAHVLDGTAELEVARAAIDYLPGDSSHSGGFYLRENPERHRLEIRAEGYQEP